MTLSCKKCLHHSFEETIYFDEDETTILKTVMEENCDLWEDTIGEMGFCSDYIPKR